MNSVSVILLGLLIALASDGNMSRASIPQQSPQVSQVTLYSVLKHRGEQRTWCLKFPTDATARASRICDVRYGALYAGEEKDWLESSAADWNRSVIKDLGRRSWAEEFAVPVVEPLAKLKPGERRNVFVSTTGADGADGADGVDGLDGADGADGAGAMSGSGLTQTGMPRLERIPTRPRPPGRPKHDGKVQVSSLWVKAIPGHMYVIHVVDDKRDFYALFRVDAVERGDNCTISWKLVDAPDVSVPR